MWDYFCTRLSGDFVDANSKLNVAFHAKLTEPPGRQDVSANWEPSSKGKAELEPGTACNSVATLLSPGVPIDQWEAPGRPSSGGAMSSAEGPHPRLAVDGTRYSRRQNVIHRDNSKLDITPHLRFWLLSGGNAVATVLQWAGQSGTS